MKGVPHDPASPVLETRDLCVRLGATTALESISFALSRGDSVAVVGPNGAGNSTLFRAIAGILPLESGTITVFGSTPDSTPASPTFRRRASSTGAFPSACTTWS